MVSSPAFPAFNMPDTQTIHQSIVSETVVDQIARILGKPKSKGASFLCLLACLGVLPAEAVHGDEPNAVYRGEVEIRNQVMNCRVAVPSAGNDLVQGTFVSGLIKEFSSSEKSVLPQNPSQNCPLQKIYISDFTVEGEVDLAGLDVWPEIRFDRCVFKAPVVLTRTVFKRGFSCHRCTFVEQGSFDGLKVEGSADFESTGFSDTATFKDASIGRDLKMADSVFQNEAIFKRLHVGSDLDLDRANFFRAAWFDSASFGNFLFMAEWRLGYAEGPFLGQIICTQNPTRSQFRER